MRKKILHSFYAGLGGHTAVFFASLKHNKGVFDWLVAMYGVEDPLLSTIDQLTDSNVPFIFERKRGKFDVFHSIRYAWSIRKKRADVVFLHGGYSILYVYVFCVLFGKSKILIRETQALNLKTRRQKFNSLISLVLADRVVFLSEDYRDRFFANSWKRKFMGKSKIIPNGLDLEMFFPSSLRKSSASITIGMFSRIVLIKDYRTLIRSFATVLEKGYTQVRLVIAGDGTDLKNLMEYVDELNIAKYCVFKGLLKQEELISYLMSLDIYVHSSLGETMSNSIMQAQACGLPIIATNVFGINNVIKDGNNGYLFELGDSNSLALLLEDFIRSTEKRLAFGRKSRAYAEQYLSDELMGERYNILFQEMLNS